MQKPLLLRTNVGFVIELVSLLVSATVCWNVCPGYMDLIDRIPSSRFIGAADISLQWIHWEQ